MPPVTSYAAGQHGGHGKGQGRGFVENVRNTRRLRRWRATTLAAVMLCACVGAMLVQSAGDYANPAFRTQWDAGEAITPNFWGPLSTAKDGAMEPYGGAMRLVQYFDKGRMELTNGAVTNGLLATEMTSGRVQTGDATFAPKAPPAIPIAGDPDNPGPTYAGLASKATTLFAKTPRQMGGATARVAPAGDVTTGSAGSGIVGFTAYDDTTQHNIPQAFADYRTRAGIPAIGLAISEPFFANVKVGGMPREVVIQVFERRVLTYTASNPAAFQVEMGNIGQHYAQWQATPNATATAPPTVAMPTAPAGTARASVVAVASLPMGSTLVTPGANLTPPAGITGSAAQATALVATVQSVNTSRLTPAAVCKPGTNGTPFVCKAT